MSTKSEFASKFGLIAATVGSAVGLGNIGASRQKHRVMAALHSFYCISYVYFCWVYQ